MSVESVPVYGLGRTSDKTAVTEKLERALPKAVKVASATTNGTSSFSFSMIKLYFFLFFFCIRQKLPRSRALT